MAKTVNLRGGGSLRINLDKLKEIEKQLGIKYRSRIGVLGSKSTGRKVSVTTKDGKNKAGKAPSTQTNAEIGLIHEKGSLSRGIPRRSFLMMPLELQFNKYASVLGNIIMQGVTKDNIKEVYLKMGILAEGVVQRAFASRGFGLWAPNKPSTIARKGSDIPLIDTAQLRKSITSAVVIQ